MTLAIIPRAVLVLFALEVIAAALVYALRGRFPWLVTPRDKAPVIPAEQIAKHTFQSFHPHLGWLHRPGARWNNLTSSGTVEYVVDSRGRRKNPGFEDMPMPVSVYGDSYAFCRLVPDDQTWPHFLSRLLGVHVGNYGVGNYGLDQALLRYEAEKPQGEGVVVMAIVPETIVRVQSYWKHYFEYGNVLAFKPRFRLRDGALDLVPQCINRSEDLAVYTEKLAFIQEVDGFYHRKFRRDLIAFPVLLSLLCRPGRHLPILGHLLLGMLRGDFATGRQRAFGVILRENAEWTRRLFGEKEACDLLEALIKRFAQSCYERSAKPLLVVLPQPSDLNGQGEPTHTAFFAKMTAILPVVDFTKQFEQRKDPSELFVHGPLGPHTSRLANRHIAERLCEVVKGMVPAP